ncbi:ATP-grasp domain-containing protein [Yinghuangia soli]|uniref:ATP-grasp domain-containing protein n=1 Tax=Yinghuangia soli TaxID=2908204 RepID=A0AA41U1L8_9ACTN|nr:ATP-grasp domain-containing protein [Yinghuangia soli]MCF2530908.1 ATP-grasp domain-containing protein [Yinghuangia soli]
MKLHLVALNPTDSVTAGFLPAAARLGLDVTLFTDRAEPHKAAYAGGDAAPARIVECDVRDFRALAAAMAEGPAPDGVFSNSDHLQTQTALAADWFGLPGKDWRATLRAKNKALMRRCLADAGVDRVASAELGAGQDPASLAARELPYPCVVKPREGVASEDVYLVEDEAELLARCREIRERTPDVVLVVEEFLAGGLHTLETLGDGRVRHVLGGFRTRLSPPPTFIEEALVFDPEPPAGPAAQVLAALDALGVGFGACHTEFVVGGDGRARLIEVNYRIIGDQCDLLLQDLLGIPVFEQVLRTHLGEPLPDALPRRTDLRARVEYVCADRAGTLLSAPAAEDLVDGTGAGAGSGSGDGVRLAYRPLRETGVTAPLTGTNRDYIGVLRAIGPGQEAVDAAVDRFLAGRSWEFGA